MSRKHICEVLPQDDLKDKAANAFRIVREEEDELCLDFLDYDREEDQAIIVSRVRVKKEFLPMIVDQMMEEVGSQTPVFQA